MSGAHLAIGAALLVVMPTTALGQGYDSIFLPVRSSDARVRDAFDAGCAASPTFRGLVRRLSAFDGLVYVEPGNCTGRKGCLLHWMTAAGSRRVLRVLVHPGLDDDDLIAVTGHELQHSLEVLSHPQIRTSKDMYWFFRPGFSSARRASETAAALDAEDRIRSELKHRPDNHSGRTTACASHLRDQS